MRITGLIACILSSLLLSCSPDADEVKSESQRSSEPFRYRSPEEIELEREDSLRMERLNASPTIRDWAEDYVESFAIPGHPSFLADLYLVGIDVDRDGDSDTLAYLDVGTCGSEGGGHFAVFILEADSLRFDAAVDLAGTSFLRFDSITSMRRDTIIVSVTNEIDSPAVRYEISVVWKPGTLAEVVEPEPEYPDFIPNSRPATFDQSELRSHMAFPEEARRIGLEGDVLLYVFLSDRGRVDEIHLAAVRPEEKVVRDTFLEPAMEAVRKTRFTPAMVDGEGVKSSVLVRVIFEL